MKSFIGLSGMAILAIIILSFLDAPGQWEIPEKYQKMKNPIPSTAASIKIGKDMYKRHCKSCHGSNGKGAGTKAVKANMEVSDFTTAEFKKETDGAIFYMMTVGHNDMPSFNKKIPSSEDIIEGSFGETGSVGDLINYIRTLAK